MVARASRYTRQASEGGRHTELNTNNFKALASGHLNTPIPEKLRRILEHLATLSKFPGDVVCVDADAHPLFDVAESGRRYSCSTALHDSGFIQRAGENKLAKRGARRGPRSRLRRDGVHA